MGPELITDLLNGFLPGLENNPVESANCLEFVNFSDSAGAPPAHVDGTDLHFRTSVEVFVMIGDVYEVCVRHAKTVEISIGEKSLVESSDGRIFCR